MNMAAPLSRWHRPTHKLGLFSDQAGALPEPGPALGDDAIGKSGRVARTVNGDPEPDGVLTVVEAAGPPV
jgi:hypothetical protein